MSSFLYTMWWKDPNSNLLQWGLAVYPVLFIKKILFLHWMVLVPWTVEKWLNINVWVYIWILNSIPLFCISIFMPIPKCLGYCCYVVSVKSESVSPLNLSFSILFWIVWVPCNSLLILESDCQPLEKMGILIGIVFNL